MSDVLRGGDLAGAELLNGAERRAEAQLRLGAVHNGDEPIPGGLQSTVHLSLELEANGPTARLTVHVAEQLADQLHHNAEYPRQSIARRAHCGLRRYARAVAGRSDRRNCQVDECATTGRR